MTGIIILNYRTWNTTLRCIQSIQSTEPEGTYHIYLIDNASPNPMPEELHTYIERYQNIITYQQAKENRGYAAGNNIGIALAKKDGCDMLLITNNDIVFHKHSISTLVDSLKNHPEAGIAGPRVVNEDGETQISRCSMKTGMKEVLQINTILKLVCKKKWKKYYCLDQNPEEAVYVYHVSGCCFAMTGECADQVTPLDEGTVLYNEELILGIRMEEAGWKTYYEPQSVVVHQHGHTTGQVQPFMYQCISQSELYYCSKYLHAKRWQLWLLMRYRMLLYKVRTRGDKVLKAHNTQYIKTITEYWNNLSKNTDI